MTDLDPPRKRTKRLELILLVAGIVGTGAWLASDAIRILAMGWDSWVALRNSRNEAVSPARPHQHPTPANNDLIGRIAIPRLNLVTTVREGTGHRTLAIASGHIRGTTLPGQNGNVGVAGHRDTFFRGLAGVRADDEIEFETADARYVYQVASTTVVKPDAVEVLKPGLYPELTLVTCYPFDALGSAPDRFIVKARLISQNPLRRNLAEARQIESVKQIPAAVPPPPTPTPTPTTPGKVPFQVAKSRSRQLAPGISIGVTNTDPQARRVDGWLWVMPDRRTIWLRKQPAHQPLVFYQDGERRELMIAGITSGAASGYLLLQQQASR